MRRSHKKRLLFILSASLLVLLFFVSIGRGTVYDLFSYRDILGSVAQEALHFKVNDQDMDMFIGKQDDGGALLTMARNDRSLPFYRDKNGGLAVHLHGQIGKASVSAPGTLMSMIEPLLGFNNGSNRTTKYVAVRLQKGFDINKFMDETVHDSKDLPVYPSAIKINTMQTMKFSLGHYKAEATMDAVKLYYNARLQSEGYKKVHEEKGLTAYQTRTQLCIVDVEEKEPGHVSIITYTVTNK